MKKYFPHLDIYSFEGKYLRDNNFDTQSKSFLEIEKNLLGNYLFLKWEVRNINYDILYFYETGSATRIKSIGIYESTN